MARLSLGLPLVIAALGAGAAAAAEAPHGAEDARSDTVYALPGVSVEGRRLALTRDLRLRPGFSVLCPVDSLPSPSATASEALSQAVGVHVRRYGGPGAYSAVSVRGSNANQVAFYLDGVPLNQAQYGVLDASDLPLSALERLEVYRGAGPLALASPGGGAVNLVTRAAGGTRLEARAGYGSFASRRAEAWGSWVGARARAFGAYRLLASAGDFVFLDDNGTPINTADDERVPRRNNALTSQGLTAKLEAALAGRVTLAADLLAKRAGMPGISSFQSTSARYATDRGVASLTWAPPAPARALELETQAYAVGTRERFRDRGNELGSGSQDTDDRAASWGARQRLGLSAGPLAQALELLAEARREEFAPGVLSPAPSRGPVSRRESVILAAEERFEPWRGRLALSGWARREAVFDDFPRSSAYAGAMARPAVARTIRRTTGGAGVRARLPAALVLRANGSRSARVPTLLELYGNRGAVVGNRSLLPERVDGYDAGLSWAGEVPLALPGAGRRLALDAEIAAYRTHARDLIVFVQNSQRAAVAQNVSAARLQGIEVSAAARAGALRVAANWTHQSTRDRSGVPSWNGRRLPGRPADEVFTRVAWESRRGHAFHELEYVSGNFLDRGNRDPVPARRLHHVGAGVSVAGGAVRLTAELRNVLDDRAQDVAAYPLPGRSYSVTAEVKL